MHRTELTAPAGVAAEAQPWPIPEHFTEAVTPHLDRLVTAARGILGSDDLAWDAVQETLLSLWREEKLPLNLPAWLARAVFHRSLQCLRTRTRRRKHEERAASARLEGSWRDDPSWVAESREIRSTVETALAQLPDDQREVFVLRELEQLDYDSIAEVLQVPVGTVRSRLNRSRLALREILGEQLSEN
jgi:RNA polymerase sigma-70 factor (ECF subfamily)